MIRAKILDGDGLVVCRVEVPNEDVLALSVPPGGSWEPIENLDTHLVVTRVDGRAVAITERFTDELQGDEEIVPLGTTLETLNDIDFDEYRARRKGHIDELAGRARLQYLTVIPGQDYVYTAKYEEAVRLLAGEPPGPFLSAEANPMAAAEDIIASKSRADEVLAEIEVRRLAAKRAIDEAPDDRDIIDQIVEEFG